MTPEELKKIKEKAFEESDVSAIWESPIHLITKTQDISFGEALDELVMKAVHEIGVVIDKEELVAALQADRERYETAWAKGYNVCRKVYTQKLEEIFNMIGGPLA